MQPNNTVTRDTYSGGPVGSTIPGMSQLNAWNAQLSTGQTMSPEVIAQAQKGVESANQNIQNTMTPQSRQTYLDQTNVAPMQTNFDELAQKLAAYDNIVLKPEFAGQNPGLPSEMDRISGYYNPDLTYAGTGNLTPERVLYNANPTYALSSQVDQGNSIVQLLGTLNKALANEAARGTAKYTSDLRSLSTALEPLQRLLEKNADIQEREKDRQLQRELKNLELANKGQTTDNKIATLAGLLRTRSGIDGYVSPKDWATIKKQAADMGVDSATFDAQFADSYANPDQELLYPSDSYNISDIYKKKGTLTSDLKLKAMQKVGRNVVDALDLTPDSVKNSTGSEKALKTLGAANLTLPFNIPGSTLVRDKEGTDLLDLEQKYFALVQAALTSIQGTRPSDYDVKSWQQKIGPSIANSPQVNEDRINGILKMISEKRIIAPEGTQTQTIKLQKEGKIIEGPINSPNIQKLLDQGWRKM